MAPTDWLAFSRRAAEAARSALRELTTAVERAERLGRGEGGDMTLAIDRAAEDAVFAELDALGVGLTAVSEERGEVEIAGGGATRLVLDPVDGSLNAKRRLPPYALSLAVADGDRMGDVHFAYVMDLPTGVEWRAVRGEGAYRADERLGPPSAATRLELLGVESAHPPLVASAGQALATTSAHRLRMIGTIALALCDVAACRLDGLVSLRPARSFDFAAGQLIVREAGGAVAFPDVEGDPALDLDMRSRVVAAPTTGILDELLEVTRMVGS